MKRLIFLLVLVGLIFSASGESADIQDAICDVIDMGVDINNICG